MTDSADQSEEEVMAEEERTKRRQTAKELMAQSTREFVLFRKMTQRLDKFSAHFSNIGSEDRINEEDKTLSEIMSDAYSSSNVDSQKSLPESKKQAILINDVISSIIDGRDGKTKNV